MIGVEVTLDQRALDRAIARLERYDLKRPSNVKRVQRVYLEGAKQLIAPMRREAPKGPTGNLRRSIGARNPRLRGGEMAVASVGPRGGRYKGGHRWLVTAGTQPHSLAPRRKGPWVVIPGDMLAEGAFGPTRGDRVFPGASVAHPGQRGNPFVERVFDRYGEQVKSFINREVLRYGGETVR